MIPTLGRAELLTRALEALARQARKPDEVLVVDNGPTEATRIAVSRFETLLPIRYLIETKRGAGAARNLGIRNATGDILAFTDDDCEPDSHWLYYLELDFLRDPAIGVVAGRVVPSDDVSTVVERFAAANHRLCETPRDHA